MNPQNYASYQKIADSAMIPWSQKALQMPRGLMVNYLLFGDVAPSILKLPHRFIAPESNGAEKIAATLAIRWIPMWTQADSVVLGDVSFFQGAGTQTLREKLASMKYEDRECPVILFPDNVSTEMSQALSAIMATERVAPSILSKHWNAQVTQIAEAVGFCYIILSEATNYDLFVITPKMDLTLKQIDKLLPGSPQVIFSNGQFEYPSELSSQVLAQCGVAEPSADSSA